MMLKQAMVRYVFGLVFATVGLLALAGDGQARGVFGDRVAGTYFVEQSTGSFRVITLNRDGVLSAIDSSQGGSLIEEGTDEFSSQHGSWRQTGSRELVATVIDFGLGEGSTADTIVATYELSFGNDFDSIEGVITLLFFAPGVNPFVDDSEPIEGPVEITIEGTRVEPGIFQP